MKCVYLLSSLSLLIGVSVSMPVYADPPSHAPAHGWRKKHDPYYLGYDGRNWPRDYGVIDGRCDYEAVSTVVGGVIGGAVGSTIGEGGDRAVAIIVGVVVGAVIGNQIGKELDEGDRGCIGHTLELTRDRSLVYWANPNNGLNYTVTPISSFTSNGLKCRNYDLLIRGDGVKQNRREKACLGKDGNWQPFRK